MRSVSLIEDALKEPVWDDGIEVIHGTTDYLVLVVRCDRGTLDRLEQFMSECVALPKAENEEVAFAFREIVTNVIEKGKFDSEQFVEVCYLKSKRQVTWGGRHTRENGWFSFFMASILAYVIR